MAVVIPLIHFIIIRTTSCDVDGGDSGDSGVFEFGTPMK
jgi:hypothetical protein